jgi:pyrroline-5-carboxylate reductase
MDKKWGLVGIGKLGEALLEQMQIQSIQIGIFHPNKQRAYITAEKYPATHVLEQKDFTSLDYLILALPAHQFAPFISRISENYQQQNSPCLVNMATSTNTDDLIDQYPQFKWVGMKLLGHAQALKQDGEGLFITEIKSHPTREQQDVIRFFEGIGTVHIDKEKNVEKINYIATYTGLKAAKELKAKLTQEGFPDLYQKQVLGTILPGVIQAYVHNQLGHFAQKIVHKIEEEQGVSKGLKK